MGALFVLLALAQTTWTFITVFTINGLCILWTVVYSYLVYRSDPHRTSPAATSPGNEQSLEH
jgi:hypothetical protein